MKLLILALIQLAVAIPHGGDGTTGPQMNYQSMVENLPESCGPQVFRECLEYETMVNDYRIKEAQKLGITPVDQRDWFNWREADPKKVRSHRRKHSSATYYYEEARKYHYKIYKKLFVSGWDWDPEMKQFKYTDPLRDGRFSIKSNLRGRIFAKDSSTNDDYIRVSSNRLLPLYLEENYIREKRFYWPTLQIEKMRSQSWFTEGYLTRPEVIAGMERYAEFEGRQFNGEKSFVLDRMMRDIVKGRPFA